MNVQVALCGDSRVLPGMAVTVRSALENCSKPIDVHIVSAGLRESDKEKLRRSWVHPNCGRVAFAEIRRERLQRFRSKSFLKSKVAYARYFLAELFPALTRCIYLDTDLLVLRDLDGAFSMPLGANLAAAVRDVAMQSRDSPGLRERLGLGNERNYFNSGFMVLELDAWRREGLTDRLVDTSIERFDALDWQDQDALNIVLEHRTLLIDSTWNTSHYERPDPLAGHVLHLHDPVKPWHARYKAKFRDSYYEQVIFTAFTDVLDRTDFRGWRPWDFMGLGRSIETVRQRIPTHDMIMGKLRRHFRIAGRNSPSPTAARWRGH